MCLLFWSVCVEHQAFGSSSSSVRRKVHPSMTVSLPRTSKMKGKTQGVPGWWLAGPDTVVQLLPPDCYWSLYVVTETVIKRTCLRVWLPLPPHPHTCEKLKIFLKKGALDFIESHTTANYCETSPLFALSVLVNGFLQQLIFWRVRIQIRTYGNIMLTSFELTSKFTKLIEREIENFPV